LICHRKFAEWRLPGIAFGWKALLLHHFTSKSFGRQPGLCVLTKTIAHWAKDMGISPFGFGLDLMTNMID
jgi:hypothetical protein